MHKETDRQVKITVQVQCNSCTNSVRHMEGELYVRAAKSEGSSTKEEIHHVLACFLLSDLLPWKLASQSHASGPGYSGHMCTGCKNTSVQAHSTVPRPRLMPNTLSSPALHTHTEQQQQGCSLTQRSNEPAVSSQKARSFLCVPVTFKELPKSSS